MFFDIALLCPQSNGKFAIVWIAATRGCNKLSKKQILNVDVVRTCSDIASMCLNESQKPRERLSLSLSARLINGVIKILFQQTRILQDHLFQCWTLPTTLLIEPVGTTRKKVPKKIRIRTLPAVEIQPQQPGQTDVVTEFIITDQDVEQALHQQPTTHIDSITLREEMPLRTVARDEDNFFGDEGLTLQERLEFERSWHKDSSQGRRKVATERAQAVQLEEDQLPALQIEKLAQEQEEVVIEQPQEKEQAVPSTDVIEQVEKQPRTSTRRTARKVVQTEEELQETPQAQRTPGAVGESPAKRKRLIRALEPEFAAEGKGLHPKLLVKVNARLKKVQQRCGSEDYEMWTPARYNLDSQRYNTLLKELQDFFGTLRGRGPELAEELQPTDSRETDSRQTVRRVTGDTPIASRHSQKGISPQDVQTRGDDEIRMTRQRQLSGKKSSIPEVEVPAIPPVIAGETTPVTAHDTIPLPASADTTSAIRGVAEKTSTILETIIEEIPPAAKTAYERIVVDTIPEAIVAKKKALKINERQQKIIDIVKNWTFNLTNLTIEDLVEEPFNKLKMSVAFYDLLYLHKLQYVRIVKKEYSTEIDHIEEGAKM